MALLRNHKFGVHDGRDLDRFGQQLTERGRDSLGRGLAVRLPDGRDDCHKVNPQ
jgi:hypothetical protein